MLKSVTRRASVVCRFQASKVIHSALLFLVYVSGQTKEIRVHAFVVGDSIGSTGKQEDGRCFVSSGVQK